MYFLSWGICRARMRWAREHSPPGSTPEHGQPNHLVKTSNGHQAWTCISRHWQQHRRLEQASETPHRPHARRQSKPPLPKPWPDVGRRNLRPTAQTARHSADASNTLRASSQFARVAKGVDLRSTAGNCAWVRTPQLTFLLSRAMSHDTHDTPFHPLLLF